MSLQAILFDCDGVLVDTERDGHRIAFNKAFAAKGIDVEWSVDRYGALLSTAGGKERMRRHFDETDWPVGEEARDGLIKDLHRLKTDLFMDQITSGALPLRPGVSRIMEDAIEAGITLAVCSTSNERSVRAIVDVLLGPRIASHTTVFAGDMVSAKKPDPAIYLRALDDLDLDPVRCVVIEDSHIGLTAARAAGLRCLVTKSSYTADEDFSAADRVVANLGETGMRGIGLEELKRVALNRI